MFLSFILFFAPVAEQFSTGKKALVIYDENSPCRQLPISIVKSTQASNRDANVITQHPLGDEHGVKYDPSVAAYVLKV